MEKDIKLLSNKFERNEMVIRRMVDFALKDGFSLEETILFIEDFLMQKVCNKVCSSKNNCE